MEWLNMDVKIKLSQIFNAIRDNKIKFTIIVFANLLSALLISVIIPQFGSVSASKETINMPAFVIFSSLCFLFSLIIFFISYMPVNKACVTCQVREHSIININWLLSVLLSNETNYSKIINDENFEKDINYQKKFNEYRELLKKIENSGKYKEEYNLLCNYCKNSIIIFKNILMGIYGCKINSWSLMWRENDGTLRIDKSLSQDLMNYELNMKFKDTGVAVAAANNKCVRYSSNVSKDKMFKIPDGGTPSFKSLICIPLLKDFTSESEVIGVLNFQGNEEEAFGKIDEEQFEKVQHLTKLFAQALYIGTMSLCYNVMIRNK